MPILEQNIMISQAAFEADGSRINGPNYQDPGKE